MSLVSRIAVEKLFTTQLGVGFTASEIIPSFLFLGTERDACNAEALKEHNIFYVLNVAKVLAYLNFSADSLSDSLIFGLRFWTQECEVKYDSAELTVQSIPLTDAIDENIYSHFAAACDFIDSARAAGKGVLVNCRMGIRYSGTSV